MSNTSCRPFNRRSALPKNNEALIQSAGYTHLLQVGSAADLPTLSGSSSWQRASSQLQETLGTISNYLFPRSQAFTNEEQAAATDAKDSTPLSYVIQQQLLSGFLPDNIRMAKDIFFSLGNPINDRKLQLEQVVGWLSTAGKKRGHDSNKAVNGVQDLLINVLWNDLAHPPRVNLNPKYKFRTPDGSYNNITGSPFLGAANQPYSRSVNPIHPVPLGLAEPEEMFDAILRRPPGYKAFVPHPDQISSLFFAFANIVIHDIFWTNHGPEAIVPGEEINTNNDPSKGTPWQNLTSSYASLDPLYGTNESEQNRVRNRDLLGQGLLYNDTFASGRILLMPPSSSALLVLFSRNHNRIAQKLLELNERQTWSKDFDKMTPVELEQQDDEIFGTARHVNCGYYAGILLHDYLQAILNTTKSDSDWTLNPRNPIKTPLGSTPTATGNSVSVEFNLLYRWHAALSWSQTKWLEGKFGGVNPSKNWDEVTQEDFMAVCGSLKRDLNAEGVEPRYWKLSKYETRISETGPPELTDEGVYERDPVTGKFRDEDLARILKDATNEVAGAFGARHIPAVMRYVECAGMHLARNVWKCATLNEFRSFLGLEEFKTFQDWNSDPTIASAMEELVGHPANIPLYVGLHGEEAKKVGTGAGVCLPYTISRAILSDAIGLIRGDRFYTDSATAETMTDWGLEDCESDSRNGAYGGMLEKMLRNNLPNQYVFNDCALLFPFMVPKHSYQFLKEISNQHALNYSLHPSRLPQLAYQQIKSGDDTLVYEVSDHSDIEIQRMGLVLGLSNMNSNVKLVYEAFQVVMSNPNATKFRIYIQSRIQQCSVKRNPLSEDMTVDITRDVTNPLISGWLAHVFGLAETGIHSEQLLLCALSDIYCYLTESPQITFKSHNSARVAASGLVWQIKYHIQSAGYPNNSIGSYVKNVASKITVGALDVMQDSIKLVSGQKPDLKHVHADTKVFYHTLRSRNDAQQSPLTIDELAADCLRAISTLAYTIVNGTAHTVDQLIPDATNKPQEVPKLRSTLLDLIMNENRSSLKGGYLRHALESVRISHWNPSLRGMIVEPEDQSRKSQPNRPIGILDTNFRLDRELSTYARLLDVEGHGLPMFEYILPVIVKEVFSLPKIRRAPGGQGNLSKIMITGEVAGVPTMHIRYDGTKNV